VCVPAKGEGGYDKGKGKEAGGEKRRQTLTSLCFVILKTVTAGSDQSVTWPCVTVSQQHCQVSVASDATNNAILYGADCVSPLVFVWA